GTGNGTVNYSVGANASSVARIGTMTIAGQTFSILQFGDASGCTVSPITIGQTINGALSAGDCFSPIRSTQASGNYRADRYSFTGTIGQQLVITLNSAQFDTYLYLLGTDGNLVAQDEDGGGGTNSRIPAFSGNFTIPVTGTYTIEVTSSLSNVTGNYSVDLSVGAATCTFLISPNSQSFGSSGGSGSITVTTGVSCNWTAVSNDSSFINTTSGTPGSGVGTVGYTVSVNPGAARTGTITIAGQTFTVSQAAGPGCTYSISPANQTYTANGGGGTISVVAPAGCNWTAVSNAAFINVTAGFTGSGNGTVSYTVGVNSSGAARAGTITVAGKTFTVVQSTNIAGVTILLLSPLPKVKEPVEIDGTTQPGYAGTPLVEINGAAVGGGNGLEITAGNSTVRALTLNRFSSNNRVSALVLITNGNNIVEGCYFGSNSVGTGGFAPFGAGPIAAGISVRSSSGNRIGGTVSAARNLISGVDGSGIIISGGATGNLVQGNYISTDITGSVSLGNQRNGVYIQGASGNIIGGTAAGAGNLISGNLDYGVYLQDDARNNLVQGNLIGTNATGIQAVPNGNAGVFVYNPTGLGAASLNITVGGTTSAARNTISGNDPYGVALGTGATGTLVQGNFIGTAVNGNTSLGNSYGVTITQATGTTVGGAVAGARNIISGNSLTGVSIGFLNNGQTGGTGSTVQGNFIGTNVNGVAGVGNGQDGVFVEVNSIVHTVKNNIIAFNSQTGVRIPDTTSNPGTAGLRIDVTTNQIFSNGLLGIDLGAPGLTPNDTGDLDFGADTLLNFPILTSVTVSGGSTHIVGNLNSAPNSDFFIEFFSSTQCTGSNPGASQQLLSLPVLFHTDGSGNAPIDLTLMVVPSGGFINAVSRDILGNTSEFSPCFAVGGASCGFSIAPTSISLVAGGGGGSVAVQAPAGCAWQAASNDAFITITSGANGTGNGSVTYTVSANASSNARTGTMTIAGQPFTVSQDGACTFSV